MALDLWEVLDMDLDPWEDQALGLVQKVLDLYQDQDLLEALDQDQDLLEALDQDLLEALDQDQDLLKALALDPDLLEDLDLLVGLDLFLEDNNSTLQPVH